MDLCRECLGLRGPCFDSFGRCERTQRCACEPKEPLWTGYDYNCAIELCHLCGAATVRSGSRWSLFFCARCSTPVNAYNRAAGAVVIPIGRHSIMNGVVLSGRAAASPVARDAFAAAMTSLEGRIGRLFRWQRDKVRRLLRKLPEGGATVPLETYLEVARARSEDVDALIAELTHA
jgi:hypothetical protein